MSTILIVEDDAALLRALAAKLLKEGYDVATAQDGEEAITKIKEGPHAVLLDIMLPKKNGIEVLEELQHIPGLKEIPIIIISNSGQPVEIERARRLGAKDFLIKTDFTPQEVLDKLHRFLPPPEKKREPGTATAAREGLRGHILVVEDDSFLRKLLAEKLERGGYEVQQAPGGREALVALRERVPTLVLLDLVMPGVDGFQVIAAMRKDERTRQIPIVVLSNLGEREHIAHAKTLGADDYLVKAHFTLDEIIERVSNMITTRYL